MAGRWCDWRRVRRLSGLALGLGTAAFAVLLLPPWVRVLCTSMPICRIAIGLLEALKIAYGVVLVSSLFGAIVLGGIFWLGRHRRVSRPMVARVLVLCGTCLIGLANEFSARIPWSRKIHRYRDDRPSFASGFERLAGGATPLFNLIEREIDGYRIEIVPRPRFKPLLVDVPAYTPEEFAASLIDFRRRLKAIVAFTERVGAIPILVVPPGNDAGFEPLRSFLRADTPRRRREAFAVDFRAARQLEAAEPALSIKRYRSLLARQPGFAEAHFRLARQLEKTGAWEEAYRQYIDARDFDGMPMRCLSAFQQTYFDVAEKYDCVLVDGQALFHAIGPHGMLDETLFCDVVHPSLRGHIALASGILDALRERGALGWPAGLPTPAIDPAQCAVHFALKATDWIAVCEERQKFYWAAGNLRHDPGQCRAKERAYKEAARRIGAGEAPESLGIPNVGVPPPLPAQSAAAGLGNAGSSAPVAHVG